MPSMTFTIPGAAMGKPRMTRRDKWAQRDAVVRYRAWADQVRASAGFMAKRTLTKPVSLTCWFFLPMPASWSKIKQANHLGRAHTGKPDTDNLLKSVMDSLWENDSLVFKVTAAKFWHDSPMVSVIVEEEL